MACSFRIAFSTLSQGNAFDRVVNIKIILLASCRCGICGGCRGGVCWLFL